MDHQRDRIEPIKLATGKNGAIRKFWPRGHGRTRWYRAVWGKIDHGHYGYKNVDPTQQEQVLIDEEVARREEAQVKQLEPGKPHLRVVA